MPDVALSSAGADIFLTAATFWETAGRSRLAFVEDASQSPSDSYRRLDAEVLGIQYLLSAYRTRLNSLAPIARLPPELLVHIFTLCASQDQPGSASDQEGNFPCYLGWIQVTHVSRCWRHTALGCRSLWARINFKLGDDWTREFLDRAGSAPLAFEGPLNLPRVDVVLAHLSHTRALDFMSTIEKADSDAFRVLCGALTEPAPILETLSLWSRPRAITPSLPSSLFRQYSPRLRTISLINVASFPWNAKLDGIVDLDLVLSRSLAPPPSLNEVLEFIRASPSLEQLSLWHCIPAATQDQAIAPAERSIHMPSLKSFSLGGDAYGCSTVLKHIAFPSTTHVRLVIDQPTVGREALIRSIIPDLFSHLRITKRNENPCFKLLVKLHFNNTDAEASFSVWTQPDHFDGRPDVILSLHFVVSINAWTPPFATVAWHAFREALSSDMGRLRFITVENDYSSPSNDGWFEFFGPMDGQMGGVEELSAQAYAGITLCHALSMSVPATNRANWDWQPFKSPSAEWIDADEGRMFFLPELTSLTLCAVNMSAQVHIGSDMEDPVCLSVALPLWLFARRLSGSPLRNLRLVSCTSQSGWDWLKCLAGVVDAVTFVDDV
ncbi:hypothetical protein FA95DRAFT_1421891 [Auriscalpium vulgare]|uniref:Uncharacterized protein n=1 Tax=Auriscalpium vulgare TaxID=40419 RepID=A0ACB8RPV4_9AGAM|nr:hypothetical protein FA95DRAFT_1421891 [Auriscalpium vulgare]